MRSTFKRTGIVLFLSSVLVLQAGGVSVRAETTELPNNWTVAAYGDNTQVFIPTDINSKGVVVGYLQQSDGYYPAQLVDGELRLLGGGTQQGQAAAINDNGVIVGTANYPDSRTVAAIFASGSATELNDGHAYDIDDSGTIVGEVNNVPAYWPHGGAPLALPPLLEGQGAWVTATNQQGWMVGSAIGPRSSEDGQLANHAVLWRDGQITDLGAAAAGDTIATGVNDKGTIVAFTQLTDATDPSTWSFTSFTWDDGVTTPLPVPEGDTGCSATSISDSGWVAGSCGVGGQEQHGVLWVDGQVIELEELLGKGWKAGSAVINEDGQIVGQGFYQGELKVYVLTPDELGSCRMKCILKQLA